MPAAPNKGRCPSDRSKKTGASPQNGECCKYDLKLQAGIRATKGIEFCDCLETQLRAMTPTQRKVCVNNEFSLCVQPVMEMSLKSVVFWMTDPDLFLNSTMFSLA